MPNECRQNVVTLKRYISEQKKKNKNKEIRLILKHHMFVSITTNQPFYFKISISITSIIVSCFTSN